MAEAMPFPKSLPSFAPPAKVLIYKDFSDKSFILKDLANHSR